MGVGKKHRVTGKGVRHKNRPSMSKKKKSTHIPNSVWPYENFVAGEGSLHLAGPISLTPLEGKYKYPLLCHKEHSAWPIKSA